MASKKIQDYSLDLIPKGLRQGLRVFTVRDCRVPVTDVLLRNEKKGPIFS